MYRKGAEVQYVSVLSNYGLIKKTVVDKFNDTATNPISDKRYNATNIISD